MQNVMHQVEATLHDLVEFMFLHNKNNTKVLLNLPYGEDAIRNNHDLFVFLLDMLCKGLVLLYGDQDRKVPIESLTQEQLAHVTQKLKNAGIILKVDIIPIEMVDGATIMSMKPSIYKGATEELKDYKMRLISKSVEYTIRFELARVELPIPGAPRVGHYQ